jgi:F-type H+-transporting ATPase subunit delta
MSDLTTLAKPYAKAVYALAKEQSTVAVWENLLGTLKDIVTLPETQQLLDMPEFDRAKAAQLLVKLLGGDLDQFGVNFIRLLAKNHRIDLIADIAQQFDALKAQDENKTHVNLTTAVSVEDEVQRRLTEEVSKKLNTESALQFEVDENIIGGIVLRIDDKVIDISIKNALKRLQKQLGVGSAHC